MKDLFYAESVVVVGVSESMMNLAKNVVANLINLGYRGKIYAVGPRGGEIYGVHIYRSVAALPEKAELAVILTPARFVGEMLAQCGEKGARWAVIETAGFQELGPQGEILETEILETVKKYGIRFVGPNCIGIINTANGLYLPFTVLAAPYRRGKIGVFAQSGGVGLCLTQRLSLSGVGISKFVSMGNKLDLDEADYLAYLMDDPDTEIIDFYLEDFRRGRLFADLAKNCSKPIILHKSNTSAASSAIAQSHTAALAGDDRVVDAVCSECGILRVHSFSEAINAAKGLSLPPLKGRNLAVVSRSGGQAVVAADACASYGFNLPPLDSDILSEAQSHSRAGVIRFGNPVDLGDIFDMPFYARLVERVLNQQDIDGVVFVQESQMMLEAKGSLPLVEGMYSLSLKVGKPVATVLEVPFEERVRLEKDSNAPFFLEPLEAVRALAAHLKWSQTEAPKRLRPRPDLSQAPLTGKEDIQRWFAQIERENRQPLLHEALGLMDLAGVPCVPWRMARNLDQALEASEQIGFPVALKAVSPSLLHKSDRGAIALDVGDAGSLREEWHRLQKVSGDISGIVVQKMAKASRELVVGGKRDPSFGPLVLTGLGGIMVEVMKDVSMRLAPIDTDTAMEMFEELSGRAILGRFRGMREADLEAAGQILTRVSLLMYHFPQIREMDLNPVGLNDDGKGAVVLDARVLI